MAVIRPEAGTFNRISIGALPRSSINKTLLRDHRMWSAILVALEILGKNNAVKVLHLSFKYFIFASCSVRGQSVWDLNEMSHVLRAAKKSGKA